MLRKGYMFGLAGHESPTARVIGLTKAYLAEHLHEAIRLNETSLDAIIAHIKGENIQIVLVDDGLSVAVALALKGLGVVLILIGSNPALVPLADLSIDPSLPSNPALFSGPRFVVSTVPTAVSYEELAGLMKLPADSLRDSVESSGADQELLGMADLFKILEWDSQFFGFPIGFVSCRRLTPAIQNLVSQFAAANRLRLLEYLCNCHDRTSVVTAEMAGYSFVDIRVTLECSLRKAPVKLPLGFSMRRAMTTDIPTLMGMAREVYRDSRYFFDPQFDRARVRMFFPSWIEKAVLGTFDNYCVLLVTAEGRIGGFCTIRDRTPRSVQIGLYGIDESCQGSGIATAFLLCVLQDLLAEGKRSVDVVTQGRNYRAQRLYQRCGFLTKTTELWYHKWFV